MRVRGGEEETEAEGEDEGHEEDGEGEDEAVTRRERTSDSYGQVTVLLYIKWVKDILALSPRVLGVPAKMLGVQSNTQISLTMYF